MPRGIVTPRHNSSPTLSAPSSPHDVRRDQHTPSAMPYSNIMQHPGSFTTVLYHIAPTAQVQAPRLLFPPAGSSFCHWFGVCRSLHIYCTQNFVILPKGIHIIYFCLITIFISLSHSQKLSVCLSPSAQLVSFPQAPHHVLLPPAVINPEKQHMGNSCHWRGGGTVEPNLIQQLNNIYKRKRKRLPGILEIVRGHTLRGCDLNSVGDV